MEFRHDVLLMGHNVVWDYFQLDPLEIFRSGGYTTDEEVDVQTNKRGADKNIKKCCGQYIQCLNMTIQRARGDKGKKVP